MSLRRVAKKPESASDGPPALGDFTTIPGRTGVVIGIPHGTFDQGTDEIGARVTALSGAAGVIATGFCGRRTGGVRLNVNRPTEGMSVAGATERLTPRARAVHAAYLCRVRATAAGALRVYCEIHGNGRPITAERIEVATAGVDVALARRLRAAAGDPLRALGDACGVDLGLAIEPDGALHFTASSARQWPPFADAGRVLHVELPRIARAPHARAPAAILVTALLGALDRSDP